LALSLSVRKITSRPWVRFWVEPKNEGGKGVMVDYRYIDGAKVLPSDAEVKKLRPANP